MSTSWNVYDVCDKKITLVVLKHPFGFELCNSPWRNDEEIASRAIQFYPENVFLPTTIAITLETERFRKTKFYNLYILIFLYDFYFDNNFHIYTDVHPFEKHGYYLFQNF